MRAVHSAREAQEVCPLVPRPLKLCSLPSMSLAISSDFCPDTLYGKGCNDPSCVGNHDVRICELCVVICSPASKYDTHILTKTHRGREKNAPALAAPLPKGNRRCTVCSVNVTAGDFTWKTHLAGESHKQHQQLAILREAYEQAELDKQSVSVSHSGGGVDFGVVSFGKACEGVRVEVTLSTKSSHAINVVQTKVRSRIPNHASL